jgi:hypothetical protein
MKENLASNSGYKFESKNPSNTETGQRIIAPHRGDVSPPEAHTQMMRYLPDFFDGPNSIHEIINSAEHFYILNADEKQIHYSLEMCTFAGTEYLLVDLLIYQRESAQQSVAINQSDFIMALLSTNQSTTSLSGETPYKYFGWFVSLNMGCPVMRKNDLKCLKVVWSGEVRNNFNHELVLEYTDINGLGPKMELNFKDKTLSLPHLKLKTSLPKTVSFDNTSQAGQPLVYQEIIIENNLLDISFHGDAINHIGNQRVILPAAIHAFYP